MRRTGVVQVVGHGRRRRYVLAEEK
jgi:hypothetical protein